MALFGVFLGQIVRQHQLTFSHVGMENRHGGHCWCFGMWHCGHLAFLGIGLSSLLLQWHGHLDEHGHWRQILDTCLVLPRGKPSGINPSLCCKTFQNIVVSASKSGLTTLLSPHCSLHNQPQMSQNLYISLSLHWRPLKVWNHIIYGPLIMQQFHLN